MPDRSIVTAVASYCSRSAAQSDFRALCEDAHDSRAGAVTAALVEKGSDGKLVIDRHECTSVFPIWRGAVLGSVLTVLAPPVGILFFVRMVSSVAVLAGIGALVGHFWNNVPQEDLRRMSELLESSQSALVIVASDREDEEMELLMPGATTRLVAKTTADLDLDFDRAMHEVATIG